MRAVVSVSDRGQPMMAMWAKAVALGGGDRAMAQQIAEQLRLPEQVVKTLQAPMMTSDTDMAGMANTLTILTSFIPMLRNTSVFFRLLDGMMMRLPLRSRATWLTGSASVSVTKQGEAIRVGRMASDNLFIEPVRSDGIIVFSKEILKWLSAGGEAFLSFELRRAIVASVDVGFLDIIEDGSTPTRASVGSSPEAAVSDLKFLLDSTELKADSKPLFLLAPDVARRAAALFDGNGGGFVFPSMSPTGGTLLNVPAMACDAMAAGSIGLIDGAGIAGDVEGAEMKSTRQANIQLESAPDSPATASTVTVSLFQAGLVGIMPQIYFGAQRLRTSAYATVTAVAWGSTDSPA